MKVWVVVPIMAISLTASAQAPAPPPASDPLSALETKYAKIKAHPVWAKPGAQEVLRTAHDTLRDGYAQKKWPDVGLEDLAVEALQEGQDLFEDPVKRWGPTTAEQTQDFLGQTTIGPWQMTTSNIRNVYGKPYGVMRGWSETDLTVFCGKHPEIQAAMIADYIGQACAQYGRRSPYAIQSYFWLDAFCRGKIGQGAWDDSVLKRPMKESGFYAKQIVCGHRDQKYGLLYWLAVTESWDEARELIHAWKTEVKYEWVMDGKGGHAEPTKQPGGFGLRSGDLKYVPDDAVRKKLAALLE